MGGSMSACEAGVEADTGTRALHSNTQPRLRGDQLHHRGVPPGSQAVAGTLQL